MSRYARLLLAGALLCVLTVGASLAPWRTDPLRELARAQPERAFAARLSIATEYRPCTPLPAPENGTVPRAACGPVRDAPPAADALAAAAVSSDPVSLRASALAALLWWDGTDPSLDDVIVRLGRALRLSRDQLPLLVDLSGAHLVRAERTQNPRDLAMGLNFALEALGRAPRERAALFNAALALELLAIDEVAADAWDAYLAVDPASPWADEARRRKASVLERPAAAAPGPGASAAEVEAFAARDPQRTRALGWDHALGAWGRAVEAGAPERAAPYLALAEELGAALERRGGDATLADAVRAIRAAAGDPAATRALAWAHRAYADGQVLFEEANHLAAGDTFAGIVRARPPSPALVQWARAFRGGSLVYRMEFSRAVSLFATVLSQADSVRHPALVARVQWMWSTALLRNAEYAEARAGFGSAVRGFERLGEREFLGATVGLDGETAYEQGDTLEAYRSLHRALLLLREHRGSVWRHNQLLMLARFATRDGMPWAATPIQDEGFANSRRSDLLKVRVEALLARAKVRALTGQVAQAARDLDVAAPLVAEMKPGTMRDWFDGDLQFSRAIAGAGTDPARFAATLDSVVAFASGRNVVWLLSALFWRADVRLARGDPAGAAADLDTATARIRGLSRREPDAALRAAMIEQARSRFDQLVMLHVRAGRADEALQALERGRISFAPAADAHLPAPGSRPAAPPGEVAVEYALIGDTLLTWTVRDTAVRLLRRTVDRDELLLTIERVGAALETPAGAASARAGLARLYDWLVRPVRDRLGAPETPLVIVADGEVAGVPFPALRDAGRGRYLLEDHPLRFAASLADAHGLTPPPAGSAGPALLVADPAFDLLEYPTLDLLHGARAETDSLRALYPDPVVLAGRDATLAALARMAPRASVIHYAGHAVFDDARPERSFLVLAGGGDSGRLAAETVSGMELGGVRLVVLSACRTLPSRQGRSGGFAGMSGALLAAGAGGVVGSLWKVDDRLAQPLMLAFHREHLRTGHPARALREAQLHLLRSPDPALRSPAAWAGYRYAGR